MVKDYKGKSYKNISEMCRANGITYAVYHKRKKLKWGLKRILTTPLNGTMVCQDHKGNTYSTLKEMCEAYNLTSDVFLKRMNESKWSLERALETPVKSHCIPCQDHKGNSYPSKKAMCMAYGISDKDLYNRLHSGYSLEDALESNIRK